MEQFIQTIREVQMSEKFEKYYTPEQREELAQRRIGVGEDRIRQAEKEWAELFDRFRTEMTKGTDAENEAVQELVGRYTGLINEFTGGNKEIEASMAKMYNAEPNLLQQFGMGFDQDLREYIGKAMAAGRSSQ